MSRTFTRVAPLPEAFALDDAQVRTSPLYGRLIFLALPDDAAARSLMAQLTAPAGARLVPWRIGLFTHALRRPWAAYQVDSDVGLAQLVAADELLLAVRGLADDLYRAVLAGATTLIDWSPAHADPDAVTMIRSVYPDACVITRSEVASSLPEHARQGVLVDDDPAVVLRAVPPSPAGAPDGVADVPIDQSLFGRLVVVVGCGRSGTTWLEELLMAHPSVGGAPRTESWIFQQLEPLWAAYDYADSGLSAEVAREWFRRALRRFCDSVLSAARERHRPGARFFVEKTPVHSYHLRQISDIYPDAFVLHLIRDGRDVARSMSQVPFFQVPDPADAARLWGTVVTTVRHDAAGLPRYRELRYEEVYSDPAATLVEVFRWLGLGISSDVASRVEAVAGRRVSAHAGTAAGVGSGSWRRLPAAEIARIYRAAGEVLVGEGYVSRAEMWRRRLAPGTALRTRCRATEASP